jgi:serine/threonine-protein phosphatase 6 regulatory ankyrin repeat subunit B
MQIRFERPLIVSSRVGLPRQIRAGLFALGLLLLNCPARGEDDLLALAAQGLKHEELRAALKKLPGNLNDIRDPRQRTALHISVGRRQFEDVLLLLLAGADPNAVDDDGQTPLFRAVALWREDALLMVELLALAGADVNRVDTEGMTVLATAAGYGSPEVVDFLLRRGAALEPAGAPPTRWPIAIARAYENPKALAVLEAAQSAPAPVLPESAEPLESRFLKATRAADLASVPVLLKAGADINARDSEGATALYRAVSDHRPDLVTLLLLAGANPNIANNKGFSPLMAATPFFDMGGTRAFLLLILAGADAKYVSVEGRTALTEAVSRRNNLAATWCVWQGADLEAKAPEGSVMQLAKANSGWPSMVELLKSFGAKDDAAVEKPESVLFDAVRAGDAAAVKAALERGISASVVDEKGCPPLSWAAHYGKFEVVDLLMQNGADINQRNSKTSKTTFQELALWGRATGSAQLAAQHMEQLLKRGADANILTKDGQTALMIAARTGTSGENLKLLLRVTTDINARDKDGKTALKIAREFGFSDVAALLVERGATE